MSLFGGIQFFSKEPSVSDNKEKTHQLAPASVSFLLHASVAMIISPIVVVVEILGAAVIFNNSRGIESILSVGGVANPVLWGPGLILGLLVNRFALKSTACWVWLAGMVWIACGIFASLHAYHARFSGICFPLDNIRGAFFSFGSNYAFCGGGENVFRFTVPAFSSITYSLGAWAALQFCRSRQSSLP
jgi:hypothetical protein